MSQSWTTNLSISEKEHIVECTIRWSPWGSMEKWIINRIVPAEAGIYQIWVKESASIALLTTHTCYYGGIRHMLRDIIDEISPAGQKMRNVIAGREAWFRFSTLHSKIYLQLIDSWFNDTTNLHDKEGREVLIHEIDIAKKFPLPPPDIKDADKKLMKDSEYGPPLGRFSIQSTRLKS